jgi:hypothetical protein
MCDKQNTTINFGTPYKGRRNSVQGGGEWKEDIIFENREKENSLPLSNIYNVFTEKEEKENFFRSEILDREGERNVGDKEKKFSAESRENETKRMTRRENHGKNKNKNKNKRRNTRRKRNKKYIQDEVILSLSQEGSKEQERKENEEKEKLIIDFSCSRVTGDQEYNGGSARPMGGNDRLMGGTDKNMGGNVRGPGIVSGQPAHSVRGEREIFSNIQTPTTNYKMKIISRGKI